MGDTHPNQSLLQRHGGGRRNTLASPVSSHWLNPSDASWHTFIRSVPWIRGGQGLGLLADRSWASIGIVPCSTPGGRGTFFTLPELLQNTLLTPMESVFSFFIFSPFPLFLPPSLSLSLLFFLEKYQRINQEIKQRRKDVSRFKCHMAGLGVWILTQRVPWSPLKASHASDLASVLRATNEPPHSVLVFDWTSACSVLGCTDCLGRAVTHWFLWKMVWEDLGASPGCFYMLSQLVWVFNSQFSDSVFRYYINLCSLYSFLNRKRESQSSNFIFSKKRVIIGACHWPLLVSSVHLSNFKL